MSSSSIETFKEELKAFLKNLIKVFPDDRDIKVLSSSLNIAMMDEEEKTIEKFYTILKPYDELIQSRNPEFFTQAKTIDSEITLFKKLDYYWEGLDDDNRKVVWDYIQVLYMLAKSIFV